MSSPSFQIVQTCQSLSATNITNKYVEIMVTWPLPFTNRLAYAPATSSWSTRAGTAILDTFQQSGFRDVTSCSIVVVLNLVAGATAGDCMYVNAIAYGTIATACT